MMSSIMGILVPRVVGPDSSLLLELREPIFQLGQAVTYRWIPPSPGSVFDLNFERPLSGNRPDKYDRPDRMQREQTQPARGMNGFFMRMMPLLGDCVRQIVQVDEGKKNHGQPETQDDQ